MIRRIFFVLVLTWALAGTAHAAEGPFSLEFRTGFEYDSAVAVLELDQSAGAGDVAALIDLGLKFKKGLGNRFKVNAGYNFSQALHEQFEAFDTRIHRGSAGLGYDLGFVDAGANVQYANAALDGEEFLEMRQVSPYLSRLFGKRLFLRLAYTRTEKLFTESTGRDATADSPGIDAFVFMNHTQSHVMVGYQHDEEDALDDRYDFIGSKIKTHFSHRTFWGAREVTFKTGLRYERRDYREALLPGTGLRRDDRYRFETRMDLSISRRGFLRVGYEYADNRSNEASVNFDEHVVSLGLGAKL